MLLAIAAVAAIAAIARGIYQLGELENRYQASLPPAPSYALPHQWGGPVPTVEGADMRPIYPMSAYPQAPPPGPWVDPEPAPPEGGENPVTAPGSESWVISEPHPLNPEPGPDIVALLAAAPYPLQGVYSQDEMALFAALKGTGRKQTEIISLMYHAAKGGTERYQRARERYMVLLKNWIPDQAIAPATTTTTGA